MWSGVSARSRWRGARDRNANDPIGVPEHRQAIARTTDRDSLTARHPWGPIHARSLSMGRPGRSSRRDTGRRGGSGPQAGPHDREERGLFGNSESHGSRCRPILIRSTDVALYAPKRNHRSGCAGCDPSSTSKNGQKVGAGKSRGCHQRPRLHNDPLPHAIFLSRRRSRVPWEIGSDRVDLDLA